MRNLFAFLFRYRGILVFALLEVLSVYLLIRNSAYQRAAFFQLGQHLCRTAAGMAYAGVGIF
ncbi:hypothetical protein [Hymenobacter sp. NBH84]|uniref:hypothetical protein n=1 Tax=Hymenobacter sp. NBH84 TaxID=2596915 RepID=UPI0021561DF1|nr:hypothetical protein [Hymenobacter sp. NBH84]